MPDAAEINPEDYLFVAVCPSRDVPEGERVFFDVGNEAVVLFNVSGKYYAIGDVCTHDNGPVGEGDLEGHEIICPRHGARFDIRDGKALRMPAVVPVPWYPVRVVEGNLEIGLKKL
ncbi:MAG: non-heme iron oxygenase ferredoxin subunit [Anaerolineaceae bacterium]